MIQRHSIVLWRKAEDSKKSFEEFSQDAYDTLNVLQSFPDEYRPNYLSAKSKKDITKFNWNYENFCEALKEGVNKEGNNIFENLGYSISFFSTLDEGSSCSFRMTAGNKSEKFYNTLVINLPVSLDLGNEENADLVRQIFEKLVVVYRPYWGCISNKAISRKYGKFLDGNIPTTVHWMNYWSDDIIEGVGMSRIESALSDNSDVSFCNGILTIKETAFNADVADDIRIHDEIHDAFLNI